MIDVVCEFSSSFDNVICLNGAALPLPRTTNFTNPTSVRFQGRQVRMKVETSQNSDWRVGIMRLEARQGSRR